ncbi:MAG: S41 family peptidase [Planctomycetes bacterium]|nr:S41 family peptidase [Planctomycetota bacterium]
MHRRPWLSLLFLALLLGVVPGLGQEADPPGEGASAPESPASPAGEGSAAAEPEGYEGWKALGETREAAGQWLDALKAYRLARRAVLRELGLPPEVEDGADERLKGLRVRIEGCARSYGIEERYKSPDFTDSADTLAKDRARDLVEEVFERVKHFYVAEAELGPLFARGLRSLGRTIELPGLRARYTSLADAEARASFQEDLERVALKAAERSDATPEACKEWISYLLDLNDVSCAVPAGVMAYELIMGALEGLDPFTTFMNELETRKFMETFSGDYAGIGAYVGLRGEDQVFTIISPIYSGPAYKAGLLSGDAIVEIEGHPTAGQKIDALVRELKGAPGTSVTVLVQRDGWDKPRSFTIERADIHIETVRSRMLPGEIGYVSLNQFNHSATTELRDAVAALQEAGMQGLVLDLRGNPGGYLEGAVAVADLFVGGRKLLVYSQGRNELIARRKDYYSTDAGTFKDFPMVVLVNSQSASASEIVSGALQQHKRARLVGEKTFGKGSVQQLMRLRTSGKECLLRLTIAKYFLPDGTSIHEKGIAPDATVEPETYTEAELTEVERLRNANVFRDFAAGLLAGNPDGATTLADADVESVDDYPGLASFHEGLETSLSLDDTRRLVRVALRQKVADARGKEFVADIPEDRVLQRGIVEVLGELHVDTASIPEYSRF